MLRPIVGTIVPLLLVAGCGGDTGGTSTAGPSSPTSVGPPTARGLPTVRVRGAGDAVVLQPWSWCWSDEQSGLCADGVPPDQLTDVGAAEELVLTFAAEGWTFDATFRPTGQPCGRVQTVAVEPIGGQEHRIPPAGLAGTYDVDLLGQGPQGSVSLGAQWTTTSDGQMPTPTATASVLADLDGTLTSYGIDVELDDLGATPQHAEAAITVTSSEGRSSTFEVIRSDEECQEEGHVSFAGSVEQGRQAAELGTPPFTYAVDLVLDGRRHTATATWPADLVENSIASVGLDVDPLLPALTPSLIEP